MAVAHPNKFKCLKFTANWLDWGDFMPYEGYVNPNTSGLITWTPNIVGGKLIGGVLHGDVPEGPWCCGEYPCTEGGGPLKQGGGTLTIDIISCKTLKAEVTGDGAGFFSYPLVELRNTATYADVIYTFSMSAENEDACPVTTAAIATTGYDPYGYGSSSVINPGYLEPGCSHRRITYYMGEPYESSASSYTLTVEVNNSYSAAYEFDITLTLI